MQKFLLGLLDLFRGVLTGLGADYNQLRAIVETKLITDRRRQSVMYRQKADTESNNTFLITILIYGILGGFISLVVYAIPSLMLSLILFFSYIMVMIVMTLITDFSSVLLDTSDNTIILPRPVDGRTLFMARIVHILLYLGQLAIGLSLFPAIAVGLKYGGIMSLIFCITVMLASLMAVVLTNAFYLLIMQFASEEKLKNIINYLQIGMAIVFMGGYQILPRLMERMDLEHFAFDMKWWSYILPPVWFAATLDTFYSSAYDASHLILTGFAVIVPIASVYVVNKYLSPVFSRKLSVIQVDVDKKVISKKDGVSFFDRVSGWVTNHPFEQGAFDLVQRIIGRDRKLKLKLYPAFGYVLIFGLIFMMQGKRDFAETWYNLPHTNYHLMLIYLTFMVIQVAVFEIPYSDDFKASWMYSSLPVDRPGEILSGMLKAIFVKLFLPGYLFLSVVILFIWGQASLDDIVFGLSNNFIMLILLSMINKRFLPFSQAPNMRTQSGNILRSMLTFLCIGIIGLSHYGLSFLPPFVMLGLIPVQALAIYVLLRIYKRIGWEQITL